jgi:ABC-2 type transport system ATP-binding protein
MRNPPGSVDLLVAGGLAVGHGVAPVCASVDLRLSAGRALAVVGPNGSGTSTLLRTLVGLLEPLTGTVTVAGARATSGRRPSAATWPPSWTTTPPSCRSPAASTRC